MRFDSAGKPTRARITVALAACLATTACSTGASQVYVLEGTVTGAAEGSVTLYRAGKYVGHTFEEIDSASIEDGRFTFRGRLDHPEVVYLRFSEDGPRVPLFLENSVVTVSADATDPERLEVTGSTIHEQLQQFQARFDQLDRSVEGIDDRLDAAVESGNPERFRLEHEKRAAQAKRKELTRAFVLQHGDSMLAPYLALRHLSSEMDVDELAPLVDAFDPALAESAYVRQLRERVETLSTVAIGSTAPDFALPTADGQTVTLSSLRGKYVLIDFWASWCDPCREQNPELVALYEELRGRDFEILGVALEFDRDPWLQAIDDDGLPWINLCDVQGFDTEPAQLLAIRSIPFTVVLDKQGVIIAKNLPGDELHALLRSLVGLNSGAGA